MKAGVKVKLNTIPRKVVRFDATHQLVWDFQRMQSLRLSPWSLQGLVLVLRERDHNKIVFLENSLVPAKVSF